MSVCLQRNVELDLGIKTNGISSAIRTKNIRLELELIEQPAPDFGRQQGETKQFTRAAITRGLA